MGVEGLLADTPQALDQPGTEGDVRNEMAVHDVEVEAVGAGPERLSGIPGEVRKVGVEDAGADEGATGRHQRSALWPATAASRSAERRSPLRSPLMATSLCRTITSRR